MAPPPQTYLQGRQKIGDFGSSVPNKATVVRCSSAKTMSLRAYNSALTYSLMPKGVKIIPVCVNSNRSFLAIPRVVAVPIQIYMSMKMIRIDLTDQQVI